jgi:broad specificity phosphatase PhoE
VVLVVAHGGVMRGIHQKLNNGGKAKTFFNNGELMALSRDGSKWSLNR